jgi:integrase
MEQINDFALAGGVRVGEICDIAFDDVDWSNNTMTIRGRKDPKQKIGNNRVALCCLRR